MYKNLRWKLLTIAAVAGLAIFLFTPPSVKIKLGLDLRGGVHLVYQVQTDDAIRVETETASEQFQEALKSEGITVGAVRVTGLQEFVIEGVPPEMDARFRTLAQGQLGVSFDRDASGTTHTFRMKPN